MATFNPINWQVSEIVQWFDAEELVINAAFQRRSVWPVSAKTYLIDTILNGLPIPKIYTRVKIDTITQRGIKEVVDGQQRIRAIHEFAKNKLVLSSHSECYRGKTYSTLDDDSKIQFLGYLISVEQLLNATDDDVVDVFKRLNTYNAVLNPAEKRHAEHQTEFKWEVRRAAQRWQPLFEQFKLFSLQQRLRMQDDEFMAECMAILLDGVGDSSPGRLNSLYRKYSDRAFTTELRTATRTHLDSAFDYLTTELAPVLRGALAKPYHVLMMFAALAHHRFGIPAGQVEAMPPRCALAPTDMILDRLARIEEALQGSSSAPEYGAFVEASERGTNRLKGRTIRFGTLAEAFAEA